MFTHNAVKVVPRLDIDMWFYAVFIVVCLCRPTYCEGSCPPTLSVDICDAGCGPDQPCNASKLCCPTVCGGSMCVDSVTKRNFVNLVKPGRCPEFPRGVWVCANMCTGDSDCPRTLKCCANRCGALTCQRPDQDPDIDVRNDVPHDE